MNRRTFLITSVAAAAAATAAPGQVLPRAGELDLFEGWSLVAQTSIGDLVFELPDIEQSYEDGRLKEIRFGTVEFMCLESCELRRFRAQHPTELELAIELPIESAQRDLPMAMTAGDKIRVAEWNVQFTETI